MTQYSDEQLNAFIDGELSAEDHAELAEALVEDETLANRLEQLQGADLSFRHSLSAIDQKPLPDRIEQLLQSADQAPVDETPIAANDNSPWRAVAASIALVVAFAAGGLLNPFGQVVKPNGSTLAGLSAQPEIGAFLETGESGATSALDDGRRIELRLSFVSNSALPCREFRLGDAGAATQAVACRSPDGSWETVLAAQADPFAEQTDGYRTASASDDAFGSAVGSLMQSDSLAADEETALISRGWELSQ